MKTIKIIGGTYLYAGVHRTPEHAPFDVPDALADELVAIGRARTLTATSALVHRGFVAGREPAEPAAEATPARPKRAN